MSGFAKPEPSITRGSGGTCWSFLGTAGLSLWPDASPCKGLLFLASLEAWGWGAVTGLDLKAHPLVLSMTSATVDSQVVEGSMKFR